MDKRQITVNEKLVDEEKIARVLVNGKPVMEPVVVDELAGYCVVVVPKLPTKIKETENPNPDTDVIDDTAELEWELKTITGKVKVVYK